jgi:hypothetical protein
MQTRNVRVSTTHPDIHINICFSRLSVEKLIVVQVVNIFPVFCENHKRSPLTKSKEENNSYGENISSDSQEILRIL